MKLTGSTRRKRKPSEKRVMRLATKYADGASTVLFDVTSWHMAMRVGYLGGYKQALLDTQKKRRR